MRYSCAISVTWMPVLERTWLIMCVRVAKRTDTKDVSDETSVRRTSCVARIAPTNNGYFQVIDVSSKVEEFNLQRAAPLTRKCSRYKLCSQTWKVFSPSANDCAKYHLTTFYFYLSNTLYILMMDKSVL